MDKSRDNDSTNNPSKTTGMLFPASPPEALRTVIDTTLPTGGRPRTVIPGLAPANVAT